MKHSLSRFSNRLAIFLIVLVFALSTASFAHAQEDEGPLVPRGTELPSIDIIGDPVNPPVDTTPVAPSPSGSPVSQLDKMFDSVGFDDNRTENGFFTIPPDPIGAAGKTRLIAVTNVLIESRLKSGVLEWRDGLGGFFAPVGLVAGTQLFDPKIIYDKYTDRFVVVTLELKFGSTTTLTNPGNVSRILLAVSKDGSPRSGTARDWSFAAINAKFVVSGFDVWADYPGFEADDRAIYITANAFTFFGGGALSAASRLWIVDKGLGTGGFYDGGPISATRFNPYATTAGAINTTTMPAEVQGAGGTGAGTGTYLFSYSGLSDGVDEYVQVIRITNPLTTPTFQVALVVLGNIDTASGNLPDAPQLGTAVLIETNDRRALDAVWQNGELWGVLTLRPPSGPDALQTTAHWIRLNTAAIDFSTWDGALTGLVDQANIGGEDIATGTHTFFPAVAVNRDGHVALGFSASAATIYPGAYVTSRKSFDAPGTVRSSSTVAAGLDFYHRRFGAANRNRWGDYSGISIDPSNEDHVWVFNEYADIRGTILSQFPTEDGRWRCAWGRYKLLGN